MTFTLTVPAELLDELAERAAAIVLERIGATGRAASPYLTVREAADYLRCKPQRVYDLLSARRLTRYRDGSRVLVARAELDTHLGATGSSRIAPPLPRATQRRSRSGLAV